TQSELDKLLSTPLNDLSSDKLSNGYKAVMSLQENYKQSSSEYKSLTKFKDKILKQIRSQRTTKSIEELDAETLKKQSQKDK
ncbi:MAG: hypothetical protein U9N34_10295, partial [Candidatus Cloacimonadota bacterium]|nr:hypothetical protein [Candidatus Cloacimonadota bacterium]